MGDKIRFTATLTDGNGNSIEAKPTLSSIDGKLTQNVDESTGLGDGTYTVEKAGDFYVNANVNGTVDGKAASKSRAIWLDGVNATGTVTEYDLDSTLNFFTYDANNTTLVKGELPADTTSNLYKAMTTNPTDKDVVVFNSPNGGTAASNVLYLGKEYKADIVGKYLSFKYYSTHNGANSGGWAFTTRQMHNSGYDGSMGSTTYGRYILNQYDSNYQLIESTLNSSNCYGTWVTVEIKVMEWSTTADYFGMIHINGENANKYLYFTDFKVSDYSIYNEGYSDLEISVSGATGADGVVNVGDVLTVTAKALPLGATEKVEVPAALTFDNGALTLNADGTYTYTGATGDFTLTATWWCGLSAETELKAKIKPEVTAIVPTTKGSMELKEVEDKNSLGISVDGVSTVYQATTTASGETNQITIATSSNSAEYSGKIVSFKYYYTGTLMAFNVIDLELATATLDHTTRGKWTFKSYDENGNEIPAQGSTSIGKTYFNDNLMNTWITVEVEVTSIGSRNLWIHFDTASTVYFADFQVSNVSMFS